jgi:hypothetical protein
MKTLKMISALSLVLVFAATSVFARMGNDQGMVSKAKMVTYTVKVNFTPNFPAPNAHYLVAITDESGRKVVPAQPFHPGVWNYTFKEASGSFRGTRVAVLIPYPATQTGWVAAPGIVKGIFFGGATYSFELTPIAIEKTGPGDH